MRLATRGVCTALIVALVFAGASQAQTDSKELILGKWETKDKIMDMEVQNRHRVRQGQHRESDL